MAWVSHGPGVGKSGALSGTALCREKSPLTASPLAPASAQPCSLLYLWLPSELMANAFFDRALWNRIFSIALFVEHVLLETESQIPELSQLVTKHVFLLDKVSAGLQ